LAWPGQKHREWRCCPWRSGLCFRTACSLIQCHDDQLLARVDSGPHDEKDSGFVLCHRIKKLYPNTPVMMVTAVKAAKGLSFAADSAVQQSWLKADLLVDKPIRAEVLRNDVNGLLNRAST